MTDFPSIKRREKENFSKLFSGGGAPRGNFFFDFSPFQAILSRFWFFFRFLQNRSDRGGEGGRGPKILVCNFTFISWYELLCHVWSKFRSFDPLQRCAVVIGICYMLYAAKSVPATRLRCVHSVPARLRFLLPSPPSNILHKISTSLSK